MCDHSSVNVFDYRLFLKMLSCMDSEFQKFSDHYETYFFYWSFLLTLHLRVVLFTLLIKGLKCFYEYHLEEKPFDDVFLTFYKSIIYEL